MSHHTPSRRDFARTSAAACAVSVLGGSAVNSIGANESVNIACIGTGGRCRHLMQSLAKMSSVNIIGLCDVWDVSIAEARKMAPNVAFTTKNYKEVLDRKDVDAVLIGTPDHWHVPITVAACEAGKDVYVEKPLTHKIEEGQMVIDAQNKHKRIVQVGTQQRSMPQFQKAREIFQSGRLGNTHKVHLTWNRNSNRVRRSPLGIDPKSVDWKMFLGNAPEQPFDEYKFRAWRWFWDFGSGILSDLMVHHIDIVHWFFDIDHPVEATTIGDNYISKGIWETPDTTQTLLTYKNNLQVYFEGTFVNSRNGAMLEFMGSNATLYLDRGRYEIHPERGRSKPENMILGTGRRGQDFYDKPDGELLHLTNWVDCIKSRKKPNSPAESGVGAASAAHLGNIAFRSGAVARWKE